MFCSSSFGRKSPARRLILPTVLALAAAGCQREEIRVYTVPKDPPRAAVARREETPPAPRIAPRLTWKLPAGWEETSPGRMSLASFRLGGTNGSADVSITPLGQMGGRELAVVNLWREQVGQPPIGEADLKTALTAVEVAGETGNLFEIVGPGEPGRPPMRIVTAMVHRPDASWFYKLSGDDPVVTAQKPAFIEFLKTVRLHDAPPVADAGSPDTGVDTSTAKPNWSVPSAWRQQPAGPMQVAKFTVPEQGAARADVSVSVFPTDTGGTLANVNRWRAQLKLGEINQSELATVASPLDPQLPGAVLVTLANGPRRLVGAIVPRAGTYWFYKLLGDAAAVEPQREAFVAFVKSTP